MVRPEPDIVMKKPSFFGSVSDHFHDPRNRGTLRDFNRVGHAGTVGQHGCVTIYLRVEDGLVQDARHESRGCRYTSACGSLLTEWVKQRNVVECRELAVDEFTDGIEGLPVYKRHCPGLVMAALQAALSRSRVANGHGAKRSPGRRIRTHMPWACPRTVIASERGTPVWPGYGVIVSSWHQRRSADRLCGRPHRSRFASRFSDRRRSRIGEIEAGTGAGGS